MDSNSTSVKQLLKPTAFWSFDPEVNLPHIISGALVALIATGHGILMKVKKSRERRGENTLFSSLPESPPRHQQELNVSGNWKHHGYLLQAGNLSLSVLFETQVSLQFHFVMVP